MSCSPFDLRDYFLKELPEPEGKQVELHIKTCGACAEELERLRMTEAALVSLGDEEMPQRLAFVSDKIFEPSPVRRAWAALWASSARLGFASAAMLSAALVIYTIGAPAPKESRAAATRTQEIQAVVDEAVAASEAKLEQRIAAVQEENRKERRQLIAAADALMDYSKREELMVVRSNYGGRQ